MANDLLVRIDLVAGIPASVNIKRWTETGEFESKNSSALTAGVDCTNLEPYFVVCDSSLIDNSFTYLSGFDPVNDSWDQDGNPVQVSPPNGLLEFGVNVGALLEADPGFTSIIVRSRDDILLDSFSNSGLLSSSNNAN
jgi:hypothetical protein